MRVGVYGITDYAVKDSRTIREADVIYCDLRVRLTLSFLL